MSIIGLKQFQIDAIAELHQAMGLNKKEIILKSGTGSGKTVILTQFIHEFMQENGGYVTLWFSPGKGNLEEQSKRKMDLYIPEASSKLLQDALNLGFDEYDTVFVNWELVTKTGNKALTEGEEKNLFDIIKKAHNDGLEFIVVIDEEHLNKTAKADEIVKLFNPKKIIRASATPEKNPNALLIEIPEERVISEGLIKKLLVINEGIDSEVSMDNQVSYLLNLALKKQEQLRNAFITVGSVINPLIIVQVPNNSNELIDSVERHLEKQGLSYFNKQLAIWLTDKKENLDNIEDNFSPVRAIIIKQAVATGWDCPRAHILVKLRENMSETFEIQTIGRIRRMPEATHYDNTLLDYCYLYTFDEKFKDGVKLHLGKGALEARILFLKSGYKDIKFKKEKISTITTEINPLLAIEAFIEYMKKNYSLKIGKFQDNEKLLSSYGYDLGEEIKLHTYKGEISVIRKKELVHLDHVTIRMLLDTHEHGRMFHHSIGVIGRSIRLKYDNMSAIIRKIFCSEPMYKNKLLNFSPKKLYAFVLNNMARLEKDFAEAMSADKYSSAQLAMANLDSNVNEDYYLPREILFTFNANERDFDEYDKNVYEAYISSAEPRSHGEKVFENFCQNFDAINWFFKNGDKGNEYFSIVYIDNSGKKHHFYPDYIVDVSGSIWIIEIKGGETASGISQDIDKFSEKKMNALINYSKKNNLKAGFIRYNEGNMKLYISTTKYSEDMSDPCWEQLSKVFKSDKSLLV